MKKYIVLNIAPFVSWILWFICELNNIFDAVDAVIIELGLWFVVPILFTIINVVFAKGEKHFLTLNGIFALAHILGFYLSGVLYYNFISNDSETELVTNTLSLILILYISIITLICFIIQKIIKKFRHS